VRERPAHDRRREPDLLNLDAPNPRRKVGRPLTTIDLVQVEKLAAMFCTRVEIARWFGISRMSLNNRARRDPEFKAALDRGCALGRIELRRKISRLAETKPKMAIFLAKNILGYRDRPTQPVNSVLDAIRGLPPEQRREKLMAMIESMALARSRREPTGKRE